MTKYFPPKYMSALAGLVVFTFLLSGMTFQWLSVPFEDGGIQLGQGWKIEQYDAQSRQAEITQFGDAENCVTTAQGESVGFPFSTQRGQYKCTNLVAESFNRIVFAFIGAAAVAVLTSTFYRKRHPNQLKS
jgi:hypothetical protein